MPAFSHLDPGTPEGVWVADGRMDSAPPLDTDVDDLVVVAAHPDDETLGAAGLIRRVHREGGRVTVVIATDGEGSHPGSPTHSPAELAAIRRREVIAALQALAPHCRVHFLALPDGAVHENLTPLEAALGGILDGLDLVPGRAIVAAPWSGDGHRDHRVVAQAVSRSAAGRGIRHVGYPIWLWHWGTPDDVPWPLGHRLTFTDDESDAKEEAMRAHRSQVRPLSPAPGDEAIISAQMAGHFARDAEFFVSERVDTASGGASKEAAWFDAFYRRHDDPWGFDTRWYEERKRAVLMASLPSRDLGDVLEIGCATGALTRELATRARSVLALDASEVAVAAAAERLAGTDGVSLRRGAVPEDYPEGMFDTIVLSEVGYYLSARDLERTLELIDGSLSAAGTLIACHWRHPVAEYPLAGDQVHRSLRLVRSWHALARHEEEDFVLEVFSRDQASVAAREGLA